jgi:ligand-binding sensor domain-containing protein
MNILRISVLSCLLSLAISLGAQEYYLTRVASRKELGDARYNTLFQDQQSVFWIGTSKDLVAYDGFDFHHFTSGKMPINITAIYQDIDGRLWVGTDQGVVLKLADGKLYSMPMAGSVPTSRVIGFYENDQGSLFSITYGDGLWQIEDSLSRYESMLLAGDIYCVERDAQNRLWLGTDQGIQVCDFNAEVPVCFSIGAKDGLMDEIVSSLSRGPKNSIWLGTFDRGFGYITEMAERVHDADQEWAYGNIMCMSPSDNGGLWLGTESNGVFVMDSFNQLTKIRLPLESSGKIATLDTDSEGNLWILDAHDGLYRTNRHFQVLNSDIGVVQALVENNKGELIIGTNRGLFTYDLNGLNSSFVKVLGLSANIISLYIDVNNTIWAGTFGDGIIAIPLKNQRAFIFGSSDGLTDQSILSIAGKDNSLWLATLGGVTEIHHKLINNEPKILSTKNYNEEDGLGTNFIYCATIDNNNDIWFGTDGRGLSVLSNRSIRNYDKADTLTLHSVYSLAVDYDNNIWFATDENGLWMFDRSIFRPFVADRINSDIEISSLIIDSNNNLLVVTDGAISVISKQGGLIRRYNSESGLQGFSPSLNAVSRSANGNIWIGGRNKILKYRAPGSDTRNSPIIQITHVRLFHNTFDLTRTRLKHDENHLTFSFRGLWYSSPSDVGYRYRLEGLDPGWRYTNERSMAYQNIPPGKYTFIVQSSTSSTFSSEKAIYSFEIRPAFYTRLWFIIIVIVITSISVRQLIVTREKRLRRSEELQRKQVESQFQALKAQINPHFLFNILNTLVSAIEEDPDMAVIYVEKLSDFYRSILQYRDQTTIPLKDEIQLTMDYAFLLQMRFDDKLKIDIQISDNKFDIMPLTVQMLIENAVKHNVISSASPLVVSIYVEGAYLVVYNKANRKNIKTASTQFGLKSIMERYEILTSKPVVVDQDSDHFIVKIPLLDSHEISNHRR